MSDEQPDIIKTMQDRITKLEEANEFIKEENTKLSSLVARCRKEYADVDAKWKMTCMERDSMEEDLTRFKLLIDFLQRYVLDEI
jgi:septal ring factor EnvC (AmiA/AmiB activator)